MYLKIYIMKKITILLSFLTVLFISCEGEPGPPGFDGFDGADGLIGSIFEADITFTADDGYEGLVDFPTSIDVLNTDIVIAYILTGEDNGADIWEPLPQTLFFGSDILLYGYDHTTSNIRFFLDGTIDFTTLEPLFTDNVIFRVAILPADAATKINTSNFSEVMSALQVGEIERVQSGVIK
jgi:hypothetical protein